MGSCHSLKAPHFSQPSASISREGSSPGSIPLGRVANHAWQSPSPIATDAKRRPSPPQV